MRKGLAVLTVLLCAGCAQQAIQPAPKPAPAATHPKAQLGQWGVDLTGMDTSVKPGDNFFEYVNGTWVKNAKIPANRSSIGSFQKLQILSEQRMLSIMQEIAAKPEAQLSANERKMRDFYDAFVNTKAIDAAGLAPVKADLSYIGHLRNLHDVAKAMGTQRLELDGPFGLYIGVDNKDPNQYSVNLTQSGLGMPDRDFYLSDASSIVEARTAYKSYLQAMLNLSGVENPVERAAKVYDLEARIAKVQWSTADRRDPLTTYNKMTIRQLQALAPGFDWISFFKASGIPLKAADGKHSRYVVVAEKSAFPKLAKIFRETPAAVWRDYLTIRYLHAFASYLPEKIDNQNFAFYGTALGGRSAQLDRSTRGVHLIDADMGEALGKIYVAKYFPASAKAKALELVHNLIHAYEADIKTLSWMTPETRQKALQKISKLTLKIGYPDKWRDYSALDIKPGDLIGNVQRVTMFDWHRNVARLDQPVDKSEWGMTPPTINAYYNPPFNEVVFPAAILQPPFFDPNADDAVNYGGIGAVIGHEISHGYDDQGRNYDGDGVMRNWWTPVDKKNFDARTAVLVNQYSAFEPVPGLHIRGKATLGENIADNSGLAIAYKAYHISLGGKPAPVIDGYTGDQRFLLGFGQIWRAKYRESAKRTQVLQDVHSNAEFRVIGASRNLDAWYKAFNVKPTDKYYLSPDKRFHLW